MTVRCPFCGVHVGASRESVNLVRREDPAPIPTRTDAPTPRACEPHVIPGARIGNHRHGPRPCGGVGLLVVTL